MNDYLSPDQKLYLEMYSPVLLLEKDHRKNIIKMGLPEEVAEFLHVFNDKYSIWFADQFKKMPAFNNSNNQMLFLNNNRQAMQEIVDWVRTVPQINIRQYDWNQALNASREHHASLASRNLEGVETKKIIKVYPDGFYWVDLESSRDSSEGALMGHCASTSNGDTLYSLRKYDKVTNQIEGFVTIAISPDKNTWHQCKGKKNSKPKEQYFYYICDILFWADCYIYEPEYGSERDFSNIDFKNYYEENSEEFGSISNADEFMEKLEEALVSVDDFERVLKDANLKFFYVHLSDLTGDGDNVAYIDMSSMISVSLDGTDYEPEDFDGVENQYSEVAKDLIDTILEDGKINEHILEFRIEPDGWERENVEKSVNFYIDYDLGDNSNYTMDKDGLRYFEQYLDGLSNIESRADLEQIEKNIIRNIHFFAEVCGSYTSNFMDVWDQINKKEYKNILITDSASRGWIRFDSWRRKNITRFGIVTKPIEMVIESGREFTTSDIPKVSSGVNKDTLEGGTQHLILKAFIQSPEKLKLEMKNMVFSWTKSSNIQYGDFLCSYFCNYLVKEYLKLGDEWLVFITASVKTEADRYSLILKVRFNRLVSRSLQLDEDEDDETDISDEEKEKILDDVDNIEKKFSEMGRLFQEFGEKVYEPFFIKARMPTIHDIVDITPTNVGGGEESAYYIDILFKDGTKACVPQNNAQDIKRYNTIKEKIDFIRKSAEIDRMASSSLKYFDKIRYFDGGFDFKKAEKEIEKLFPRQTTFKDYYEQRYGKETDEW